mmetsp:Transcript_25795/g.42320  ORF Transcript_25795/g.42320 Transcript_25795/m.42320 type:complete len:85 (-) Transcript_25795:365-619(-)
MGVRIYSFQDVTAMSEPGGGWCISRSVPSMEATVNATLNHTFATGTDNAEELGAHPNGSLTAMLKAGEKNPKQHPPPMASSNAF